MLYNLLYQKINGKLMNDEERNEKQQFLKEEIIDKNYDADAFISFCENYRCADIDLWTLEELKICVKTFTSKILYRNYSNGDIIDCNILKPSKLSVESTKVVITMPEKGQGSPLPTNDVIYCVLTLPLAWNVKRKIGDFKWLEKELALEFPGYYIPVIDEIHKDKLEGPWKINLQLKQISLFMNYVVSSDLFKRSLCLVAFLEEENRDNLKKIKRNSIRKITDVRQMSTSDGKIACEYDNLQELTNKNSLFFDQYRDVLKKLDLESKNLNRIKLELLESITNYSSILNEIAALSTYMQVNERPMKEFYTKVSDSFIKIGEKIWQVTLTINEYLHGTMKFAKIQGQNLKDIYKEKDLAYQEVEKIKKKIAKLVAKDKAVSKDLTDKCRLLKEKAGVLNYCCRDQTEKLFLYTSRMLFEEFNEFIKKSSTSISGILTVFAMLQDSLEISKSLL